jgi:hypothetical protein
MATGSGAEIKRWDTAPRCGDHHQAREGETKMIELRNDTLIFSFPKVHEAAKLKIDFQRTLRIPDDDKEYPLPPGLGNFGLRHVDDFAENIPADWFAHGGVMLPMYQSEAMWLNFGPWSIDDHHGMPYPFAVKVAAGKICAVTGEEWSNALHRKPQDYMVVPHQPWLDGYCIEKGVIRQFVAMPLGAGYSAEEQITGKGEYGGLQIIVYPMKREAFERYFAKRRATRRGFKGVFGVTGADTLEAATMSMGLAPGGRMRQEIYDDPFEFDDWDTEHSSRCFVHIANSLVWQAITGERPPTTPPTSKQYTKAGLPWFDYYSDGGKALPGSTILEKLKSVVQMGKHKGDVPLPENESVEVERVIQLRRGLKRDQVREGEWS